MFDRLIESDSIGADFKPRRRYFVVSTVVVGLLFISAVVISLYAADIGLGNDNYELSAIVAPVQPPVDAPEPPRPDKQRNASPAQTSDRPTRVITQAPIDTPPTTIPSISTIPNKYLSIPPGVYRLGPSDTTRPPAFAPTGDAPTSSSSEEPVKTARSTETGKKPDPDPEPPRPVRPRSIGVANGYAVSLPKPIYPPVAIATNIQGKVDVQIMIDESGDVVSAKAVDGPPLLRQVAELAALKAKFKPTLLNKQPIKVTGVIVYNFTRN